MLEQKANPPRRFRVSVHHQFALAHDLAVQRRVHLVYAISLPPVVTGQIFAMWLFLARPHWWVEFAHRLTAE